MKQKILDIHGKPKESIELPGCFSGKINLAKRVGKIIFYDAINGLEFVQTNQQDI